MADYDYIDTPGRPDDFTETLASALGSIHYKMVFFIMVLYIALATDAFSDHVLDKIPGAVNYRTPTNYGTAVQSLCLGAGYILLDMLTGQKII